MEKGSFTFKTSQEICLVKITQYVNQTLKELNAKEGLCNIFAPHATGVVIILEDEEGLKRDFVKKARQLFPPEAHYDHHDDNGHAHLMSAFMGESKTVPVQDGELDLGTWQDIFFLETDGPRDQRTITVTYSK